MNAAEAEKQEPTVKMVTVLYSRHRDLYRVPGMDKACWLSVQTYLPPPTTLAVDVLYLGPSATADGQRWRKAYSLKWRAVMPGDQVTLPANDPLVLDYAAAPFPPPASGRSSPAQLRERRGERAG